MINESTRQIQILAAIALLLAALCAYQPAITAQFVWDDGAFTENPLMRTAEGLRQVWTSPSSNGREQHYWPLVYTVFWAEYHVWGLEPLGYHLINILLHAANALLLWRVLNRLGVPGSWFAGMIFVLHPVHVESVAWVIELKDVLSGFMYLAGFALFLRFETSRWRTCFSLALLCFVLAMLSKSISVTLPAALALAIWWREGHLSRAALWRILPFAVVAALMVIVDLSVVQENEKLVFHVPLGARIMIAGKAIWFYAAKLVWPANLMTIYPRWHFEHGFAAGYVYPISVLGCLTALYLLRNRIGRGAFCAAAFFVVTLSPTIGIIQFAFMRHSFVADRFQYLASAGLIALFAACAAHVTATLPASRRITAMIAASTLLAVLGMLTWLQASAYHSSETLFRLNVERNPDSAVVHYNYGISLSDQKRDAEAEREYRIALKLSPEDPYIHVGLSTVLIATGRFDEAIEHLNEALRLQPDSAETLYNLGMAWAHKKDYAKAEQCMLRALRRDPHLLNARLNYGALLARRGDYTAARTQFRTVLRTDPANQIAAKNLRSLDSVSSGTR